MILLVGAALAGDWGPWKGRWAPVEEVQAGPPAPAPEPGLLGRAWRWYRARSDGDGARCPYYPTCSAYGKGAVADNGLVLGGMLTMDRLLREYPRMAEFDHYPVVSPHGTPRLYDPPPTIFASAALSGEAPAPAPLPSPEPGLAAPPDLGDPADFGDWLLEQGDPFQALTWYRYALWQDPTRPDAGALRFRIAWCYELGERWDAADAAYGEVATFDPALEAQALYRQAVVRAAAGDLAAADVAFQSLQAVAPQSPEAARAPKAREMLYLQAGDMEGAGLPTDGLPHKSPALAGVASALVPGLGQLYAGHAGDAAMAFTASAVLTFWSATLITSGIEDDSAWRTGAGTAVAGMAALTWSSNVIGAVNGARRANRHAERRAAEARVAEGWDPALELEASEVSPPPRDTPAPTP